MSLFDALGALLAIYVGVSVTRGHVFAKSGPWGRRVSRDTEPQRFWAIIVLYAGLSLALVFLF